MKSTNCSLQRALRAAEWGRHMPLVPAVGSYRQGGLCEVEASLVYRMRKKEGEREKKEKINGFKIWTES